MKLIKKNNNWIIQIKDFSNDYELEIIVKNNDLFDVYLKNKKVRLEIISSPKIFYDENKVSVAWMLQRFPRYPDVIQDVRGRWNKLNRLFNLEITNE